MDILAFLQTLVASLFGVSLYVKMWRHSISTFIILLGITLTLFLWTINTLLSAVIFSISITYITIRGALKPIGGEKWI